MPANELTLKHLKSQLDEIGERFRHMRAEDVFIVWFLRAYVTEDDDVLGKAVTNGPGDKGIDGVFIDDATRSVFIVQAKYRTKPGIATEKRSDLLELAGLSHTLTDPREWAFREFIKDADPHLAAKITKARKEILDKDYRLWLYYVTLGKVTPSIRKDAQLQVERAKAEVRLEVFDHKRVLHVLRDYLDGVAPPIPSLDLEIEAGEGITVREVLNRYDRGNEIDSWVFPMRGDAIAEIFELGNVRLFARNIRGFLGGDTSVNKGMSETLSREPERFFYYNNGITLLCDKAENITRKGRGILRVSNPQIINGQQTTRTLALAGRKAASKASVLVKVIQVPRSPDDGFESIVSRIVAGTNWQNKISRSDLMSNDRIQIDLERELRKIGYLYIRKRQSKSEAKRLAGCKFLRAIKKDEFAKAVAGCDLDPVISRSGIENLYEKSLYQTVFPNSDPTWYLPKFWLMKGVSECSRGYPERGYAKWMVQGFVWRHLSPLVRAKRNAEAFRYLCEKRADQLKKPLMTAIDKVFSAAKRYFLANRGTGERALDPSTFYRNKRGRDKEFAHYWQEEEQIADKALTKAMERIRAAIECAVE